MNEIEKMYKNAGVKLRKVCTNVDCDCDEMFCDECEYFKDNIFAFTAEKQLELIKWITRKEGFKADGLSIEFGAYATGYAYDFEIALAKSINCFLEYCSPEEKQQIKKILE